MCKIYGPFEDRGKYRLRVQDTDTGKTTGHTYGSRDAALAAIPKLRREYTRPIGKRIDRALEGYRHHLAAKGNRPRSIDTTIERISSLFRGLEDIVTGSLRQKQVEAAWDRYSTQPGPRSGKVPSVDTRVGVLKQTRTFFRWAIASGYLKTDYLAAVKVEGRRKRGKVQLRGVDEARRYLDLVLDKGRAGDAGAIAAATALVLGVRASEILDRLVSDLDDRGTVLLIPEAKTDAGVRRFDFAHHPSTSAGEPGSGETT